MRRKLKSSLVYTAVMTALAGWLPGIGSIANAETLDISTSAPFPESVTSTQDGTLYVSSMTNGGVVRVRPGKSPEVFIKPGYFETRSTFGVYADERNQALWVCSNDASVLGIKGPSQVEGAFLKSFDLKSGQGKGSFKLPPPAICNDMAFGADGSIYVTNTAAPQILKLKPGGSDLEIWIQDEALKGGLDGIAFGSDGNLYVNTYMSGELFRVEVKDGVARKVSKLVPSRPLSHPDALKAVTNGFLMAEGGGALDLVTISDDAASIATVMSYSGPTGLTISGDTIWIADGQLAKLSDVGKGAPLPSFHLYSMSLQSAEKLVNPGSKD